MTYFKKLMLTTVLTTMAASPTLYAKQIDGTRLCKKMQRCTLAELKSQNLPPNIMQMAKDSVKGMCEQRQDEFGFDKHTTSENMMRLANQCIQSIENMSCDTLMNSDDIDTPACVKFRKVAETHDK